MNSKNDKRWQRLYHRVVKLCPDCMGTGMHRPGTGFNAIYPGGWFQMSIPKCLKCNGKGWLPDDA